MTVFTNGCFDILHAGHVDLLARARALGSRLVVGLNSDASVRELKGPSRPVHSQADRARVLLALRAVDQVEVFNTRRVDGLLRALRPAIWVKGGDYSIESLDRGEVAAAREVGAEIVILPTVQGHSTTRSLSRLQAG